MNDGDFSKSLQHWVRLYPDVGYGPRFKTWALDDNTQPYGSYGNGAAMRAAPVGWVAVNIETALILAEASATVSHNHPDGIAGAQAVALAVFLGRTGHAPSAIRVMINHHFGWKLPDHLDRVPSIVGMDVSARGTVPPAIACALAADGWEEAVRAAVGIGGDTDTQGCIAGAVAEALFGLPPVIANEAKARLDSSLLSTLNRFARFRSHPA